MKEGARVHHSYGSYAPSTYGSYEPRRVNPSTDFDATEPYRGVLGDQPVREEVAHEAERRPREGVGRRHRHVAVAAVGAWAWAVKSF